MFERKKQPWEMAGDGVVHFRQKRGGRVVNLSIGRTGVDYEIKDMNGAVKFNAMFEEIDPQASQIVEKKGNFLITGLVFFAYSLLLSLDALSRSGSFKDPLNYFWPVVFLIPGAILIGLFVWRRASFTVLNTDRGRMSIIKDARHDEILRELNLRRVSMLRAKYLQIDHDNSPKTELGKYNWLRRVGAITDVELSQFTSMLQGDSDTRLRNQPPTISQN
jgi:hypothetical protein